MNNNVKTFLTVLFAVVMAILLWKQIIFVVMLVITLALLAIAVLVIATLFK